MEGIFMTIFSLGKECYGSHDFTLFVLQKSCLLYYYVYCNFIVRHIGSMGTMTYGEGCNNIFAPYMKKGGLHLKITSFA